MAGWFLELLGPSKKHPPDGRWALSRAAERGMMAAFSSRMDSGEESDGNFAEFLFPAGFWRRV